MFHKSATQRNYGIKTGINQSGEMRVHMTLNQAAPSEDEHRLSARHFCSII
jgi:hypothetical protein